MNEENKVDMKKIFEEAKESVLDLPENLQGVAFEMAVQRLLPHKDTEIKTTTRAVQPNQVTQTSTEGGNKDFFSAMQIATNLSPAELKTVYEIDKKDLLHIVAPLDDPKISDKQRKLSYLLILGKQAGLEEEWTSAFEVSRIAREHSALNKHLAKNLALNKSDIRIIGSKRGRQYSLTPKGVQSAKSILTEIIEGAKDESTK